MNPMPLPVTHATTEASTRDPDPIAIPAPPASDGATRGWTTLKVDGLRHVVSRLAIARSVSERRVLADLRRDHHVRSYRSLEPDTLLAELECEADELDRRFHEDCRVLHAALAALEDDEPEVVRRQDQPQTEQDPRLQLGEWYVVSVAWSSAEAKSLAMVVVRARDAGEAGRAASDRLVERYRAVARIDDVYRLDRSLPAEVDPVGDGHFFFVDGPATNGDAHG